MAWAKKRNKMLMKEEHRRLEQREGLGIKVIEIRKKTEGKGWKWLDWGKGFDGRERGLVVVLTLK